MFFKNVCIISISWTIFFALIAPNLSWAVDTLCPKSLWIESNKFSRVCLNDFPISEETMAGISGGKVKDFAAKSTCVSIALPVDNSCSAVGISNFLQTYCGSTPAAKIRRDQEAINKCTTNGCKCKLVVSEWKFEDENLFYKWNNAKILEAKVNNKHFQRPEANSAAPDKLVFIPLEKEQIEKERKVVKAQVHSTSTLDLDVSNTAPDINGSFKILINTHTDTASLKINNEEAGGRVDGIYELKKVARAGQQTQFVIVATDVNGNTATKSIFVSRDVSVSIENFPALDPGKIRSMPFTENVAIIVGIEKYKRVSKADFANSDASMFYDYAIRALGIRPENIKLLLDDQADDIEIIKVFQQWLPARVKKTKSDVFFFFSGHGLSSDDGKDLYILPTGVDRDYLKKSAINQSEIITSLQSVQAKSVTIFLDVCYSGQARTGETLLAGSRPVSLKTETAAFPEGFTVITASSGNQISSSSPELKHGIFSYYLMRGMEGDADANRDGRITTGEMQAYLADNVSRQAGMMNRQQMPQLTGDANRVLVGR